MARIAIVSSRSIQSPDRVWSPKDGRYKESASRWDAGFHIVKQSLEQDGSLAKAEAMMTAQEALELIGLMPHSIKAKIAAPLARGNVQTFSMLINKALEEYPHMAIALAFRDEEADRVMRKTLDDVRARTERISEAARTFRKLST